MKIRKRVRLNTSFATKAISDRFPHFGATKIGDSGRHGNPHFSVFYTRLATQSGRYPLKDEDARPTAGESRSTGAHPASGHRQQHFPAEGRALEERTIRQAAVAPTAGRMPKAASETDGLPSSRGQTGSALSAPPHSRPAAKKRRTEEVVGSAEASYIPAGGRTAHSSGHRIGGRSPAGARPPRGRETSAPTSDPEYRLRDDTRRPTGRVLHNPEISPFLYSGIGFVPFRSRRGAASERSYLRKRLSRERVPVRRPLPPDCLVHRPGTDTSQRAGLRRGGGLPKPAASDRTTIPPVRPRPTVLYRTRRRSRHFCRRASPSATQRTFHPSYRRTRAFDDRQTAPPSFAPSERKTSIREEGTAPPDTVSIRSGALPPSSPSARRFGLRFKQSGKNKSKPPAPYHRRLSRSRPSTHTRPRPVTSNGKQRKQGRPTNLLPPLPENLLFGENTKTVTIEKRLSEIRQTASFRSESGTTRNRTGDTRIFSPLLYQLSYGTININAYVS